MSSWQLSSTLADWWFILSPVTGWSVGSTSTYKVTSQSRVAVTSWISLCLMMTYPPLAQLRHGWCRSVSLRSRSSAFCVVSICISGPEHHEMCLCADAPFSCPNSTAFFLEGSQSPILAAILFFWFLFFSFMSLLALSCFASIRSSFPPQFLISSFRGWLKVVDVAYSWSAISVRMSRPSPAGYRIFVT